MKKATYLNCNILANQTHPHFNPPFPKATFLTLPKNIVIITTLPSTTDREN